MALGVRPTDALVHRLLQQNSRTTDAVRDTPQKSALVADQVNISSEARKGAGGKVAGQGYSPVGQGISYKQEDLESRLLSLYSHSRESKP